MPIKLFEDVRHSGNLYPSGAIIDSFTEQEEKRLVNLKSAEYINLEVTSLKPSKGHNTNNNDDELTPEEFNALYKKLDESANKEPLIEAALAVGVEFSDEDLKTKKKVIEEIILQDMVEEVLTELQKGE